MLPLQFPHQPGPSRLGDASLTEIELHPHTGSGAGSGAGTSAGKRQRKATDKGGRPRSSTADSSKKKKANRACIHCQKAHLTCDDSRPCQRCVRRGIADSCMEGLRKKAKYLLDDEELGWPGDFSADDQSDITGLGLEPYATHQHHHQLGVGVGASGDPLNNVVLDTKHQFDSQAVNLEYSFMSAILGNDSSSNGTPPTTYHSVYPAMNLPFVPTDFSQPQPTPSAYTPASFEPSRQSDLAIPQLQPHPQATQQQQQQQQQQQDERASARHSAVYRSVTKAYDYRESFHFLMRHLKERYAKNDILRIIRAIAIFRPSIIALSMPLSEEDEVFVEKCFQRSVIELEKLISFNGTPTVAWRRTGEICVVGVEFSILTGWSRDELLGGRKYIYELFENQSAVEYWEQFATHAFENTTQSVHTHCVLLTKTGAPVLTAFCFSIRRDIFDLPNLVIGQWLPLLC
ncbi:hypothetical protein BKA62DRAFT_682382 [Auriculariales sp. MPI-PUGE-AT-0066]|nr:hypothetical protein BKA62DRAFT_682382 [Auriculariales sp. MPI-PUGE-AT-0066]